jgi:hypothetical protein
LSLDATPSPRGGGTLNLLASHIHDVRRAPPAGMGCLVIGQLAQQRRHENMGVGHRARQDFDHAVKRFMLTYQMVSPLIAYHLPEKHRIALRLAARSQDMSFSKQMRKIAEQHLLVLYYKSKTTVLQLGGLRQPRASLHLAMLPRGGEATNVAFVSGDLHLMKSVFHP